MTGKDSSNICIVYTNAGSQKHLKINASIRTNEGLKDLITRLTAYLPILNPEDDLGNPALEKHLLGGNDGV